MMMTTSQSITDLYTVEEHNNNDTDTATGRCRWECVVLFDPNNETLLPPPEPSPPQSHPTTILTEDERDTAAPAAERIYQAVCPTPMKSSTYHRLSNRCWQILFIFGRIVVR